MAKAVERWIHLTQLGGDAWILPVWNAVNAAKDAGSARELSPHLSRLGLSISTRFDMLPKVVDRLNADVSKLLEAARNAKPEHIFSAKREGRAYAVDESTKYAVLADIDSLLTELQACIEQMGGLFRSLCSHVGKPIPKGERFELFGKAIRDQGGSTGGFDFITAQRNFLLHQSAPYIAVDVSNQERLDLLVMKENIKSFEDESKFFRLSALNGAVQDFLGARVALQKALIKLLS